MALLHVDFYSEVLGRGAHMDAILPERCARERWRTLYLLHGMTDDHTAWQRSTSIERYADERELAVIMPGTELRWYSDTPLGENYFDYISRELVLISRRMFPRLSHDRADTFVAGNSMGGYGALKCALKRPETFSKAAALSGALDAAGLPSLPDPLGPTTYWEDTFGPIGGIAGSESDLFAAASALTQNRPDVFLWCGREDFLYSMTLRMRDHLEKLGYNLTCREARGDHQWKYWDAAIQSALDWMVPGEVEPCR